MKRIPYIFFFLIASYIGFSQTTLAVGDIVITGVNSDDTLSDEFSFVLLTDVVTSTVISFTDIGWSTGLGRFRTGPGVPGGAEGVLTWTATSDLSCGTEIVITSDPGTNTSNYYTTSGTIVESDGGFGFSPNQDQIIIYQGTHVSPTILYAIHFGSAVVNVGWSEGTNAATSAVPPSLVDGESAIYIGNYRSGSYNCTVKSGTDLVYHLVADTAYWDLQNSSNLTMGGCTYTCCSTIATWTSGAWVGTPTSSATVIIDDDYDTSIGVAGETSFSACSMIINSTYTLTIADGDHVSVENDVINDGTIVINPEGSFVQTSDDHVFLLHESGSASAEKLTAPSNDWYEYTYWSSPVENETISNALANSNPNGRYVYNAEYYRDSTFENLNDNTTSVGAGIDDIDDTAPYDWNIASATMTPGFGYASNHDPSTFSGTPNCPGPLCRIKYTFSGAFNNGSITVPVYRNDTEMGDNNWNLIGNPYPSAIDADLFLATNSGIIDETISESTPIIEGAIYLWSQNTAESVSANGNEIENFSQADYAIINGTGQTAAQDNGGDSTVPDRYIPSGQAFFISMNNAATSTQVLPTPVVGEDIQTADVTFNNAMRVTGNNTQFFRDGNTDNKLWVNLTSDNGIFSQVLVGYLNNTTDGYDGMSYDAPRNASVNVNSVIYTTIPNVEKKFTIQGKDSNSLSQDEIIPLGFYTSINEATLYTLSLDQIEGSYLNSNPVYIKDNVLTTLHNLKDSDYTFTSETGEFNERFEIVFRADALSIYDHSLNSNDLTITELSNGDVQITINSTNLIIANVEILDITGRQVYNLIGHSSTEVYELSELSKAPYIAKVRLSNGQVISKKTIKQR
ncbi:hypothetical protein [Winogradskyella sp.]|uniref:hypothetical protein n=1 Tax=Winogradskyella sp. TaxID=1883156 RepID=UPI0025CC1EDE|nr:hypothetical protein [Winogradskyella sp.]